MTTVPLRHVAEVWTSSVDKHSREGELPVQLCNYVDAYRNDTVEPGPEKMRATATPEEVSRNHLEVGDSVFTKDSEDYRDIGISAFVTATADDFVCGYHLAIARPKSLVYPRYLNWSLRGQRVLDHFGNHASGISRYGISLAGLRSAPIALPDLAEQRRIADFLDDRVARIDQIIAARRAQASATAEWLKSANSSLMDELATSSGLTPVRRLVDGIEQGSSPVAEDRPAAPGEQGVLRTSAICGGTFDSSQNKAVPAQSVDASHRVLDGDVLVTRGSGSADLVGDSAVARLSSADALFLSDLTYRLRGVRVLPQFLVLGLISARGRSELGSRVRQGSGPAKARGDDVLSVAIPRATAEQQLAVVERAHENGLWASSGQVAIAKSLVALMEYKQSLITAAVTGELDVTTACGSIPADTITTC